MSWDDFDRWSPHSVRGAAAQLVASGLLPEPEAWAQVSGQLADLLPDGIATPLHHLWSVRSDGSWIGCLWMRVGPAGHEVVADVLDIEILPEARGHGWGRSTLLAAEQMACELGASVVRLNVYLHNTPAVRLYESLSYAVTGATLTRRLDGAPAALPGDPPPEVDLEVMTDREYADFRSRLGPAALDRMLPRGPATPDHLLWRGGGEPPADIWVRLARRSDGCHAHLQAVRSPREGSDHLPSVLSVVAAACRSLEARSLTLSVPQALPARWADVSTVLTERCGLRVAAATMTKVICPT
jgi:ribosomal protein S18 acetylase RimI-like enzyme